MEAYIKKCTSISHEDTFASDLFFHNSVGQNQADTFAAKEPDYKELIANANLRRRMSRVIRMAVATALECLKESGLTEYDSTITATGMGNMTDTERFLKCVIDNDEQMLNPAFFIQSTGNTFGGQISLLTQNHGYNLTYAHGGFSFESAVIDAMMQLADNEAQNILVTAADEITAPQVDATTRMGFWRNGSKMGEGAQSFILTANGNDAMCKIKDLVTIKGPMNEGEIEKNVNDLLGRNGLKPTDIDILLHGCHTDKNAANILKNLIKNNIDYKQFCGQYMTSSSFAVWLAANMIDRQISLTDNIWQTNKVNRILIYSELLSDNYSLLLVEK